MKGKIAWLSVFMILFLLFNFHSTAIAADFVQSNDTISPTAIPTSEFTMELVCKQSPHDDEGDVSQYIDDACIHYTTEAQFDDNQSILENRFEHGIIRISKSSDGTFFVPSTKPVTLIVLDLNITGFTCWGNCTDLTSSNASITVGQLFTIVDGKFITAHSSFNEWFTEDDQDITFELNFPLEQGDHTVSFLYLGKDEKEGFKWASTSMIIRVHPNSNLDPIITRTSPLSMSFTDLADDTESLYVEAVRYNSTDDLWHRSFEYEIEGDVAISYGDNTFDEMDEIDYSNTSTEFSITGNINSSGFDDFQDVYDYNATKGHVFIADAVGIQYLGDNPTEIYIRQSQPGDAYPAETFIGLIVFAEYGRFKPEFEAWGLPDKDFDGDRIGDLVIDGSFDFIGKSFGAMITDKPGNNRLITTIDTSTTSTETNIKESPYFGEKSMFALFIPIIILKRRKINL
ncbi:MAG: hypothetical protein ACXAD7_01465 [Candidatus Kariarchaeaceae archaeon]|jgi:hypothetical protein